MFLGFLGLRQVALAFKRGKHEFAPRYKVQRKAFKGRVPVRTGGSVKGNTLEFGQYGLRLRSEGVRMLATQLREAQKVIERQVRGLGADVISRFICGLAVCVKGNQTRMGKGKGAFDHWACRVHTGKMLFEIRGNIHERQAKEALRKALAKLPGVCEIVDKMLKIRVSPVALVNPPQKVNHVELMKTSPSKKWANIQLSRQPQYQMYRGH